MGIRAMSHCAKSSSDRSQVLSAVILISHYFSFYKPFCILCRCTDALKKFPFLFYHR